MHCPSCESALEPRTSDGVEMNVCVGCGGIWIDADQLRRLKDEFDPDLKWMDFELWRHQDRFRASAKHDACPGCGARLVSIDYDHTGVEVDYCVRCRGVWLDPGELDKIVASLTDELLTKDVSDYVRASLEEAKELVTGPESVVSEWRDLSTVLRMLSYRILSNNPTVGRMLAEIQAKSQF